MEYLRNGFKVGPEYHRPPAPVAPDWIDANDKGVRSSCEDLSQWWTVFDDPVLVSLVETAYLQNLSLREAGFRILEARAQRNIAIGNFFPQQQEATGSYTRIGTSGEIANQIATPDRYISIWDYGFTLAWELDFWGRFRRAIASADADLDASVEEYDAVLVSLIGDVAAIYVEARTLEKRIDLARQNVKLQKETLDIANARFKGGETSELDVDQAQSVLAQTEASIPQLEISLRKATNQLCILLGIPPEDLSDHLGAGRIPQAPPEVAVGIPADLLRRRPDVRRAEREAAAQSEQIGIAEADFYPQCSISGSIGFAADEFRSLFNGRAMRGYVGPSFQWNLLNYGRIANNIRLQDARFQELVVAYQSTVLNANKEVEDGLVRFLRSQQSRTALQTSVESAEKAVKVAIAQYEGGLTDFNRVSVLEQNLVNQQDLLAQASGDIALGLVEVYRALGGGWQIRCRPLAATPIAQPTNWAGAMPDGERNVYTEIEPESVFVPVEASDERDSFVR